MSAPDPLLRVWARADVPEARFSADEVLSWPAGHEALLTGAEIIRLGDNVAAVPCDACADGHVEEVIRIESPVGSPVRAYILCPEAGRVAVPLDRLKQWTVDFGGLARVVARGLGLADEVEEVVPARLWFLGGMTVAGRPRDVFLARGVTWRDTPGVFGPRLRSASGEAILLVPGDLPPTDAWADLPLAILLKPIARLEAGRLAIDRDQLEGLFTAANPPHGKRQQRASPGGEHGGRPQLTQDAARQNLLDALTRLYRKYGPAALVSNVKLAEAAGVNEDTISNWLTCAGWTREQLEVQWRQLRRKKPE